MGFNIGSRVLRATGGSIKRVGNYKIHTFPEEHVTDGLSMYFDAGDPRSLYPGSTAWNDLSDGGHVGTLTNGPVYSNFAGGTIAFNASGANDQILIPESGLFHKSYTLEYWFRPTNVSNGYAVLFAMKGYDSDAKAFTMYQYNADIRFFSDPSDEYTQGNVNLTPDATSVLTTNTWHQLVITRDVLTRKLIFYKNGVLQSSSPYLHDIDHEAYNGGYGYCIGSRNAVDYPLYASVSIVRGYKRALSADEVLQNYNADKVRHGITYTGSFVPTCSGSAGKIDLLCVAAGGGGGVQHGGGGGAGGVQEVNSLSLTSEATYSVGIGSGGKGSDTAGTFSGLKGINGGNTTFSGSNITTITSIGGGGGSSMKAGNEAGNSGGSGGGSALDQTGGGGTKAGGSGTAGQGYAGGTMNGYSSTNYGGGSGGGGAGGLGGDSPYGTTYLAGAGGKGIISTISGSSVMYGSGGGGGTHAPWQRGTVTEGGGRGGNSFTEPGHNGRHGTGSGGGASGAMNYAGGSGGHGVVVVRYPAEDYNIELLIVAAGGAGGSSDNTNGSAGGGGGAGGILYYSKTPVVAGKNYLVGIGTGGRSVTGDYHGYNGNNSYFGDKVAIGGGGGGKGYKSGGAILFNNDGRIGGSGGGGGSNAGTPASGYCLGGKGLSGQGNNGGGGSDGSGADGAGGGGGAGAVGGAGVGGSSTAKGGAGGAGKAYTISGSSVTYAGGGGGGGGAGGAGAGGAGGGAAGGGSDAAGSNATANTGGGGGGSGCRGSSHNEASGAGGSGIVIIAYKGSQRGTGGVVSSTARPGYTTHTFRVEGENLFIP